MDRGLRDPLAIRLAHAASMAAQARPVSGAAVAGTVALEVKVEPEVMADAAEMGDQVTRV